MFFSANLTLMTKKQSITVCIGDKVPLEVEIGQSYGSYKVTWTHGYDAIDDPSHFSVSKEGEMLTITDILPSHSGIYYAHVRDGNSSAQVGFTVDVKGKVSLGTVTAHPSPTGGKNVFFFVLVKGERTASPIGFCSISFDSRSISLSFSRTFVYSAPGGGRETPYLK
jgi:hypothetical protein